MEQIKKIALMFLLLCIITFCYYIVETQNVTLHEYLICVVLTALSTIGYLLLYDIEYFQTNRGIVIMGVITAIMVLNLALIDSNKHHCIDSTHIECDGLCECDSMECK